MVPLLESIRTGILVSPTVCILDKYIVQKPPGDKMDYFKNELNTTSAMIKTKVFRRTVFMYSSLFYLNRISSQLGMNPYNRIALTSLFGIPYGISRDILISDTYSYTKAEEKPVVNPKSTLVFVIRDIISFAGCFIFPELVPKAHYVICSLVVCPVITQLLITPLHLLGLDLHERKDRKLSERIGIVKKYYINSVITRTFRTIATYGISNIL
jgi:hypothetical protein